MQTTQLNLWSGQMQTTQLNLWSGWMQTANLNLWTKLIPSTRLPPLWCRTSKITNINEQTTSVSRFTCFVLPHAVLPKLLLQASCFCVLLLKNNFVFSYAVLNVKILRTSCVDTDAKHFISKHISWGRNDQKYFRHGLTEVSMSSYYELRASSLIIFHASSFCYYELHDSMALHLQDCHAMPLQMLLSNLIRKQWYQSAFLTPFIST